MFKIKFMDGTPVPDEYQEKIYKLIGAAACADVDEHNEDQVRNEFSGSTKEGDNE